MFHILLRLLYTSQRVIGTGGDRPKFRPMMTMFEGTREVQQGQVAPLVSGIRLASRVMVPAGYQWPDHRR